MFRPAELIERIRRLVQARPTGHQRDGGRLMIKVLFIEGNDGRREGTQHGRRRTEP
jgi:hypothetical protein